MSLSHLPLEILSTVIGFLRIYNVLQLDACSKLMSHLLAQYRSYQFRYSCCSPSSISWAQLFKPYILLTCNQKNYLFDISTHQFELFPTMLEYRFTRYLYHIFTRRKREVVCISTSYQHRRGALECLNFIERKWSTCSLQTTIDHLSGFSGNFTLACLLLLDELFCFVINF